MNTIQTIKLHAQEIKKDKQSFIACSAEIRGKWYKIKFTKECEGTPKTKGLYDLTIDIDKCSIERGKIVKNKNGDDMKTSDTIWVKFIASITKYSEEKLKEENRASFSSVFGDDE